MKSTVKTLGLMAVSFTVGCIFGAARVRQAVMTEADAEIADVKEHYKGVIADMGKAAEVVKVHAAAEALKTYQGDQDDWKVTPVQRVEQEVVVEKTNELVTPPYLISEEEFMKGSFNYDERNLVYYKGDNVLADQEDVVLTEHERAICFGDLIGKALPVGESNAIYVRNHQLHVDFEVVINESSYENFVLGLGEDSEQPAS